MANSHDIGVLYASISTSTDIGYGLLDHAVERILECVETGEQPTEVLWSMRYQQRSQWSTAVSQDQPSKASPQPDPQELKNTMVFPSPTLDLAFDDSILEQVQEAWQKINAADPESNFMIFEDRQGLEADTSEAG